MWKKVQGGHEKCEQSDGDVSGVTKETREGRSEKQQNFCSFKHWLLRKASKSLVWCLMKTWSLSERLSQSCYSCSPTGAQHLTFWPRLGSSHSGQASSVVTFHFLAFICSSMYWLIRQWVSLSPEGLWLCSPPPQCQHFRGQEKGRRAAGPF